MKAAAMETRLEAALLVVTTDVLLGAGTDEAPV